MSDQWNGCSAGVPPAVAGASRPRFGEVTIRNRGRLPHWERNGGLYFITFRLADSLPKHVTNAIREHRKALETARANRELLPSEGELAKKVSGSAIERYLDAGTGSCALRDPRIAELVATAINHWDEQQYRVHAWCVMPNHVHAVVRLFPEVDLDRIVGAWKSYTAKQANHILQRTGPFWMREYYDRLIRDGGEFERAVSYVLANPERAGLKNWPWVGSKLMSEAMDR